VRMTYALTGAAS